MSAPASDAGTSATVDPLDATAGPVTHIDTATSAADRLRRETLQIEVPTALLIASGLLLVMSLYEMVDWGARDVDSYIGAVAVSVILALLGLATRRVRWLRVAAPWVFATAMVLVVAWLLTVFWQTPDLAHTGYLAVILVALGPVALEWAPFLAAGIAISGGTLAAVTANHWGQTSAWISTCVLAMVVSAVLLYLRRRSLAALADARALAEQRAITDPLTGPLNRNGVKAMLPGLTATALRLGQPLVVTFIDIDGLKKANDTHGHDFGDTVIAAVADAIRSTMRQGDLAARWGGDEFLVIGMGIQPDAEALAARIRARLEAGTVDLSKWPGHISIGSAHGMPHAVSIDELITRADQRMYTARQARR